MPSPPAPPIPEVVFEMVEELHLDDLLENPLTADPTIRYLCSIRKEILEAPEHAITPELAEVERLLSRIYHHIGYDRRNQAFRQGRFANRP